MVVANRETDFIRGKKHAQVIEENGKNYEFCTLLLLSFHSVVHWHSIVAFVLHPTQPRNRPNIDFYCYCRFPPQDDRHCKDRGPFKGTVYRRVAGDGDCMFHSLAYFISNDMLRDATEVVFELCLNNLDVSMSILNAILDCVFIDDFFGYFATPTKGSSGTYDTAISSSKFCSCYANFLSFVRFDCWLS